MKKRKTVAMNMEINATFNKISVTWRSILLVEKSESQYPEKITDFNDDMH
jgi:hypothetical protein